ncbi:WAP four-disulfide core domain protein 18-like [Podarcis muralis]
MKSALVVFVGVLILCAELTLAGSQTPDCESEGKPGYCPTPDGDGTCVEECSGDDSCPRDKKCCSNNCGHTCQTPLNVKPGECPKFKIPPGLPCKTDCCEDNHCKGTDKCCPMGCSKVCAPAGFDEA